ncbi:MAG: PorT family protein [Bacteroidota bacterium]|nr:PorT family protein [Bacteroidota bacterium]
MSKTWYLTLFLLIVCCNLLLAQVPAWGGGADQTDLSWGFTFGYISSNFKIVKKPDWRNPYFDPSTNRNITDSLNSISSKPLPGFVIGFIARYRLSDHLEVRATPSLVFADRSLSYVYVTSSQNVSKLVQTTTVDIPLSLKLKSDRVGDLRAYILGGVKYSQAIGSKRNTDATLALQEKLVKNISGFGSYDVGLGCDIYFEFFKLSPEIKLSNSMGNVLLPENHPFSSPISKLSLHTIMFSLYFE